MCSLLPRGHIDVTFPRVIARCYFPTIGAGGSHEPYRVIPPGGCGPRRHRTFLGRIGGDKRWSAGPFDDRFSLLTARACRRAARRDDAILSSSSTQGSRLLVARSAGTLQSGSTVIGARLSDRLASALDGARSGQGANTSWNSQ